MKGITPVIAVILLLLITVSLVGFASAWFLRIGTTSAGAIENKTQKLLAAKSIMLENAKGNAIAGTTLVDLRNIGGNVILDTEIKFYVNDLRMQATCPFTINPNVVVTCTLNPPTGFCPPGGKLRATVLGGEDFIKCR